MDLVTERREMVLSIKDYIIENKETIETEYKININERVFNKESSALAWLQVYASKILMAKNVNECREFKDIIKDFVLLNRETEVSLYFAK